MPTETQALVGAAAVEAAEHGRVASATRGRLRVRLHRPLRRAEAIERAGAHLRAQPGVREVRTNPAAGSLTVRYDPEARTASDLLSMLADVGLIVREVVAAVDEGVAGAGRSMASRALVGALNDLDRRLGRATGRRVDLKLLFPAALGLLGLRQVLAEGLGLTQVPGYVLLWYAFDAFHKLNTAPAVEATASVAAEPTAATGG